MPGNPSEITRTFLANASRADTQFIFDNYSFGFHSGTIQSFINRLGNKNIIIDNRIGPNDPEVRKQLLSSKKTTKTGYMHDKFFLFSELKGIGRNVVLQMSANINDTQYYQFNSLIGFCENETLYNQYLEHWNAVKYSIECRTDEEDEAEVRQEIIRKYRKKEPTGKFKFYGFPRHGCPIERELNEVIKTADANTHVEVCMSFFSRHRVHRQMTKLKAKGANVRIIMSDERVNEAAAELFSKSESQVPFTIIRNDDWKNRMHHKFVLIEHQGKRAAWIGSYNITRPGLRLNDEIAVRVEDDAVHKAFKTEFSVMWIRQTGEAMWFL
tara:strand:- start:387 stop:1364 length:978 start_codon:yes stop_codon:yes gene_type:complete